MTARVGKATIASVGGLTVPPSPLLEVGRNAFAGAGGLTLGGAAIVSASLSSTINITGGAAERDFIAKIDAPPAMAGSGGMAAAAAVYKIDVPPALAGAGTMSTGQTPLTEVGSIVATGLGMVGAPASPLFLISSALAGGVGTLPAMASPIRLTGAPAVAAGAGNLIGPATPLLITGTLSAITGTAALADPGSPLALAARSILAGTGGLTSNGTPSTTDPNATLAGTGTLAAPPSPLFEVGRLSMAGAITGTFSSMTLVMASATLAGVGGVTDKGSVTTFGSATLAGTGQLSGTAIRPVLGSAALAGFGAVSSDGSLLKYEISATIALTGGFAADSGVPTRLPVYAAAMFTGTGALLCQETYRPVATAALFKGAAIITGPSGYLWGGGLTFAMPITPPTVYAEVPAQIIERQTLIGGGGMATSENMPAKLASATLAGSGAMLADSQPPVSMVRGILAGVGTMTARDQGIVKLIAAAPFVGSGILSEYLWGGLTFALPQSSFPGTDADPPTHFDAFLFAATGTLTGPSSPLRVRAIAALSANASLAADAYNPLQPNVMAGDSTLLAKAHSLRRAFPLMMTGAGALLEVDSGPLQFGDVALVGSGFLTATAPLRLADAGQLVGTASLASDSAILHSQEHTALAGIGTMVPAVAVEIEAGQVAFAGFGQLRTFPGTITWPDQAALSGIGVLIEKDTQRVAATVALAGAGSLVEKDAGPFQTAAAVLAGAGSVTAAAAIAGPQTATLAGIVAMPAVPASIVTYGLADFTASGIIVSAAMVEEIASANLAGVGTLSTDGVNAKLEAGVLYGAGNMSAPEATLLAAGRVEFDGIGELDETDIATFMIAGAFNGQAKMRADAHLLDYSIDAHVLQALAGLRKVIRGYAEALDDWSIEKD